MDVKDTIQEPVERASEEMKYKPVAFKTKDGREVSFNANAQRKTSQQKRASLEAKVIKKYEAQKKRDAREAAKAAKQI